MKNIKLVLALLVSLAVTACGGGGSDSGLGSSNIPLVINSNNEQAVTATALRVASGSTFELFNPDNFATAIYDALGAGYSNKPCDGNIGTEVVDITGTGTMVYTNCTFSGKTFDGTVYLSGITLNINSDTLSSTLLFNNLTVTTNLNSAKLTGDYDLTASGLGTTYPFIFTANGIGGAKLTLTKNSGQTEVITDFNFVTHVNSQFTATYASDFILTSSSLGGSFRHLHNPAFLYETNSATLNPHPFSGEAHITGQTPTQLYITVTGNGSINRDEVIVDRSINGSTFTTYYMWADF